jgi:NAD-dependent SIR2 family protein deacetylase
MNDQQAAAAIREAAAVLIGAGAGMGVDSGLPDFRGNEGFWQAYPPFAERGLSFMDLANPDWFYSDPALAWGFYGHRLELYRSTEPHDGFALLADWAADKRHGAFVFTSNVDGQFQKAGFAPDRVAECHGSIHHLQCSASCSDAIWENTDAASVDEETFQARPPLPACPDCGAVARPNILMFGDFGWHPDRTTGRLRALDRWVHSLSDSAAVIVELGAGRAVPTVRSQCESVARLLDAPLIRINPREPEGPPGTLSFGGGALATLRRFAPLVAAEETRIQDEGSNA